MTEQATLRPSMVRRPSRSVFAVLAMGMAGCTVGPYYPLQTDYPGTGVGRIEDRSVVESAPAFYGPDGEPARIPVQVGATPTTIDSRFLYRTPGRVVYQIRTGDGTLHVVSTDRDFAVGACVHWTGYADGPSRTHWSAGRVQVEKSDECADSSRLRERSNHRIDTDRFAGIMRDVMRPSYPRKVDTDL